MEVDCRRKHRDRGRGFDGKGEKRRTEKKNVQRQSVWEKNRDPHAHISDKERAVKKYVRHNQTGRCNVH